MCPRDKLLRRSSLFAVRLDIFCQRSSEYMRADMAAGEMMRSRWQLTVTTPGVCLLRKHCT